MLVPSASLPKQVDVSKTYSVGSARSSLSKLACREGRNHTPQHPPCSSYHARCTRDSSSTGTYFQATSNVVTGWIVCLPSCKGHRCNSLYTIVARNFQWTPAASSSQNSDEAVRVCPFEICDQRQGCVGREWMGWAKQRSSWNEGMGRNTSRTRCTLPITYRLRKTLGVWRVQQQLQL